jgi:hypothetical protein
MKRGISTMGSWMGIAALAVAATVSCGSGIRDGRGDLYATKTIGPEGGQILLREATLSFEKNCVATPATITLRRYDSIAQTGSIGPVFEIEIPRPDTFINDPTIGISTLDTVAIDSKYIIGFLVPTIEQWVPDTTRPSKCAASSVCGDVQIIGFTNPGGTLQPDLKTTILELAIVQQCNNTSWLCPTGQNLACNSSACQQCPAGSCP